MPFKTGGEIIRKFKLKRWRKRKGAVFRPKRSKGHKHKWQLIKKQTIGNYYGCHCHDQKLVSRKTGKTIHYIKS